MTTFAVVHILPSDPPRPCPDLMTGDEVAILLRLQGKDQRQQLQRQRDAGLPCTMVGGRMLYPTNLVLKWIEERAGHRE